MTFHYFVYYFFTELNTNYIKIFRSPLESFVIEYKLFIIKLKFDKFNPVINEEVNLMFCFSAKI